jgi:hypothetical protein
VQAISPLGDKAGTKKLGTSIVGSVMQWDSIDWPPGDPDSPATPLHHDDAGRSVLQWWALDTLLRTSSIRTD